MSLQKLVATLTFATTLCGFGAVLMLAAPDPRPGYNFAGQFMGGMLVLLIGVSIALCALLAKEICRSDQGGSSDDVSKLDDPGG